MKSDNLDKYKTQTELGIRIRVPSVTRPSKPAAVTIVVYTLMIYVLVETDPGQKVK